MSIIGVIEADLETSGIGTPSRLAQELHGEVILRRTVLRAAEASHLKSLHVVVHRDQQKAAARLLDGLPIVLETHEVPPPVWRNQVIASRKWALDGWRGGPAGTCSFDEGFHPAVVGALAKREEAVAAACIPAAAVVLDGALLDRIVEVYLRKGETGRITFAQAPPGLAPVVWEAQVLNELGGAPHSPGRLLCYQPDEPAHDLVVSDCCYKVPAEVTHTAGRFIADNDCSMRMLGELLNWADAKPQSLNIESICRWRQEHRWMEPAFVPYEVELELTTEDQLVGFPLRPRGNTVGKRGPISVDLVQRLVSELASSDASLLVLGGFGEPLLHPEFVRILEICKPRQPNQGQGVLGLAVRTNAIDLNQERIRAMLECRVDVVSLLIDATTPETYRSVHGRDAFERVMENVEALISAIDKTGRGVPLIVPEMVKTAETLPEMEAFFDGWMRRVGWANLEPFNSGAGQREDRSVMPMAPPAREPCVRLWSRCLVLADGRIARCDQDYAGSATLGDVSSSSCRELWREGRFAELRRAHREHLWSETGFCESCAEWHRP